MNSEHCRCCGQRIDGKTKAQIAGEQREAIQRFLEETDEQ